MAMIDERTALSAGRRVVRHEPRRALAKLSDLRTVDVILPTSEGTELRRRCIPQPSDHQAILLESLGLQLPSHLKPFEMS